MMSTKCDRCTEIEQAFSRNGLFDTMRFLSVGEFCHSEGLSGEHLIRHAVHGEPFRDVAHFSQHVKAVPHFRGILYRNQVIFTFDRNASNHHILE